MRKIVSLLQCVKNWYMMYKDDVGHDADRTIMWRIGVVCRVVLLP